ncbi:hypothetical protein H9K76_01310 [Diaphorobacter ruginosibacter]|uniref:Thiamine pyrophosphate-binding protein n=2 Tax=Diaphorobacter ruginosibacter TaxID=1715720 RepID=A0A7G9RUV9_9BURK|nr:hypothetical protein H9K76_01310 [Diaphorobacter ruginosibacter]
MTGGQALARQLVAEGVSDLFGIPGVQLDWATDALLDVEKDLRYVTPRHEQATSYMADGYARTSGKEGVCMVVPGPGLLNAMAGLSTAYACNSPVLCITGQIPSHQIGQGLGMLHEVPGQSQLLNSVTKWNRLARTPQEIPSLVHQAFEQLRSGRPQPVALEIPPDVLQARADVQLLGAAAASPAAIEDKKGIEKAAELLRKARFPVIYAGGGVLAARAADALRQLAETLQAPVVMSDNARGALSSRHPLALPHLGGRCVFPHADVVLVIGSRFVDGIGRPTHASDKTQFIYLNVEARDMTTPRASGLAIEGDARLGCLALLERVEGLKAPSRSTEVSQVKAWCDEQIAFIQPQLSYVQALRDAIPEDGILVNELTQIGYASTFSYPVYSPRTFITPGYQGTLGYGFATGLGVALGNPDKAVVSINGDGGFGWNLQELATAAKYRANLVTVVFADGAFGNVKRIQSNVFKREIGTNLHNPDFLKLADAFGLNGVRVDSPDGLGSAVKSALKAGGPTLIEVQVQAMPGPWHLIHTFSKAPRVAPRTRWAKSEGRP